MVLRSSWQTTFFYCFHFSASVCRTKNLSSDGQFSLTQNFSKSYRHKRRPFSLIDGGVLPVLIHVAQVLALTLHKAAACFADNNKGSIWLISAVLLTIAAALYFEWSIVPQCACNNWTISHLFPLPTTAVHTFHFNG